MIGSGESHACALQKNRTEEMRDWLPINVWLTKNRIISRPMNICQESLAILKPMNLLLELWLGAPLFVLLAHKWSSPQPFNGHACSLLHFTIVNDNFSAIPKQTLVIRACLSLPLYLAWHWDHIFNKRLLDKANRMKSYVYSCYH